MKTVEDYFTDWESHVFGFGYGTGEEHVLWALKTFLTLLNDKGMYDYKKAEEALTPATAWLLINALCHADVIEYGTSPRHGWLTPKGKKLAAFMAARSVNELYELTSRSEDYVHCMPDYCNCNDGGDCRRENPYWLRDTLSAANNTGQDL